MGQVKTTRIKRLTNQIIERYPGKFSKDFNKNKEATDELLETESKKVRNVLAGYITHTMKKIEKLNTIKVSYQPPPPDRRKQRGRRR